MSLDDLDEIHAMGKWWVPGRDQPPHPGLLHSSREDGPSLRLFDNLGFLTKPKDGTYTDRSFLEFFPIVCGRTEIGPATLLNLCHGRAEFLIFNSLFESEKEAKFQRIQLEFKHLCEWIRKPIVTRTFKFWKDDKGKPIGNEALYQYRLLPEETFSAHGLDFRILFGLNTKGGQLTPVTLNPIEGGGRLAPPRSTCAPQLDESGCGAGC